MLRKLPIFLFFITFSAVAQQTTGTANSDDLNASLKEARALCSSLTEENKRMARAAGYDISKLCRSLESVGQSIPRSSMSQDTPVRPRSGEQAAGRTGRAQEAGKTSRLSADQMPLLDVDGYPLEVSEFEGSEEGKLEELKPFGYDLFAGEPTSFTPAMRIPVSPDYLLGPGDTLEILFYGKSNESYTLEISRNGSVDFPELGPIQLAGLTFSEAKELLLKRVGEQMIGVQASISLGELRSIQIFVLGEAYKPGAYTVSALSTITNALFLSGGVNDIASLRTIKVKRAGKQVAELDLYDLLLSGDTSADIRLQEGDVIYIPTVGKTASVDGQVRRPAIYELKLEKTAADLVRLAGGFQATAYPNSSRIHRVDSSGFMTVVDIDLTSSRGRATPVQNGDMLVVESVVERKEEIVTLSGHVYRPGEFRWRDGMRVSDVVKSVNQLKPMADLDFGLIRRELPPTGELLPVFVDLRKALSDRGGLKDVILRPRDELIVFSSRRQQPEETAERSVKSALKTSKSLINDQFSADNFEKSNEKSLNEEGLPKDFYADRQEQIKDFIADLKLQARSGKLARVVTVSGTVRNPGEYPLTEGMTITQLIAAAGGLNEAAYRQSAELSRQDLTNQDLARSQVFTIELANAYADPSADVVLQPYDSISVRTIPEYRESLVLELQGEVRFPGKYNFKRGEMLSSVISRAGGLTDLAHAKAAVFTREEIRVQEAERLQELQDQLRADIATSQLAKANEGDTTNITEAEKLLQALDTSRALGRLVIDLEGILRGKVDDIQLKDGDRLVIPAFRQEVSVIGEVQHPTAHLYNGELDVNDYIENSGGPTIRADEKRTYVVKANGSVELPRDTGWFSKKQTGVEPGDTIVVPLDVERMKALTVWSQASSIVYQIALGVAAINSL